MNDVNIGVIGLGNVGSGALSILAANADQIALKLGFRLRVTAVCSRSVAGKELPARLGEVTRTADWREVVTNPNVDIVAELIGGTTVAREIIEGAIANGKSIVTANKELMALCGAEIWDRAIKANINLAMEASVAGGIPIHAVLREGISGDRIVAIAGILNGTSNYILTEMERRGESFDSILAEAQALGYAEADPSADVDGYDARSKLAILAALAFGERITPSDIYRRRHPAHHRAGFRLCASAGPHDSSGVRRDADGARIDSFGAPGADPAVDDSGQRAGRLQRGLGEGPVRRGHVLLRARRGRESDGRGGGERSDARGAGDPQRQSGARVAVRA